MNNAAAASYIAVPSIFIVAPIGKTKLETSFDAPKLFCDAFSVIGSVALLELVANAEINDTLPPFHKDKIFTLLKMNNRVGKNIIP